MQNKITGKTAHAAKKGGLKRPDYQPVMESYIVERKKVARKLSEFSDYQARIDFHP